MPTIPLQFPASISVSNLNGVNGFAITGFPASTPYYYAGSSVSAAGDVNDDGIADFVVGAPDANSNTGLSYVIFGQSGLGSSGSIDVSSLTGSTGFVITGFPSSSQGGLAVSAAGDVNDDGIADLVIGAPHASSNAGKGYVIFGRSGLGNSGSIDVSSLTGSNGFVITGFLGGSLGGLSVSAAGDMNDDGIADLIIGAPDGYNSGKPGDVYVIFGQSGLGSSGSIDVSSLTGSNGFVITGFPSSSQGGFDISAVGDVNDDGIADMLIGAPNIDKAVSNGYVIFGKSGIGSSGSLDVSSLTGTNGFTITGFSAYGNAGASVSGTGDVNGDGIADFVIGANGSPPGADYVIFGKSGIGSSGSLDVSSLTGTHGFAITGLGVVGGAIGFVRGAGDINGDGIADIIVAVEAPTYIIFGQSGLGSSGTIGISSLTGNNGFAITGYSFTAYGYSVSGIGDVNSDGIADIVLGPLDASNYGHGTGTYVIFGEPTSVVLSKNQLTINEAQVLTLSSQYLNATNPQKPKKDSTLQFTITGLQHGRFFASSNPGVSLTAFLQQQVASGQISFAHDGSMWAPTYSVSVEYSGLFVTPSSSPQAATITFQQSFVLVNNNLTVNQGQTVILTSNYLSANDLYNSANNPNLIFSISNVQHGYFASTSAPTISITSFTQAQVQSGTIQFVHDGSVNPPSYSVAVIDGAASISAQVSTISFDAIPVFVNNNLTINQGQTVILGSNNLSATNPHNAGASLTFTISSVQNGYFALTTAPTTSITSFTQAQIQSGVVQFVHDGSSSAPSYSLTVSDGRTTSAILASAISFDAIPIFTANSLTINQGQTVVLSSSNLSVYDPYSSSFTFTVSNVQHGYFALTSAPTTPINSFTQAQIQIGNAQFIHHGGINAPGFSVSVTDGRMTSNIQAATISFDATPVIQNNSLTIGQGQKITLSSSDISAVNPYNSLATLTFTVSNVQHGYFALTNAPSTPITSFTQTQIQSGSVQFIQDGSISAPSYNILVSDGRITTGSQVSSIAFNPAPVITNNNLNLIQGQTIVFSSSNLSAVGSGNSGNYVFTVSNIQHGRFELVSNPGVAITSFTQAQIQSGAVQFVSDGSTQAPSYSISVSSGNSISLAQSSSVTFNLNATPVLIHNVLVIQQGQTIVLTSNDLSASDVDDSADSLVFSVSNLQGGYFTLTSAPTAPITSFTQGQIQAGDIEFVANGGSEAPSYSVSVSDPYSGTAPAQAVITFTPSSQQTSGGNTNTVQNAIIGGTVSGGVGILFLLLKLYLTRRATLSLQEAMEGGEGHVEKQQVIYYKEVVRPIINSVFERISTTGVLGFRSEKDLKAYIVAIESIITRLSRIGINTNLPSLSVQERSALINEIAKQTRRIVVKEHGFCSTATLCKFFKPEATPLQIEDKAQDIAAAVQKQIGGSHILPSVAAPVLSSPVSQSRESHSPSAPAFQKFVDLKEAPAVGVTTVANPNFFVSVVAVHEPQQQQSQIELEEIQPGLMQTPAG